jgi:hypothetical protein
MFPRRDSPHSGSLVSLASFPIHSGGLALAEQIEPEVSHYPSPDGRLIDDSDLKLIVALTVAVTRGKLDLAKQIGAKIREKGYDIDKHHDANLFIIRGNAEYFVVNFDIAHHSIVSRHVIIPNPFYHTGTAERGYQPCPQAPHFTAAASSSLSPERLEKLLSYLLPPNRLEEAIGDFEKGYRLMLQRHGRDHAERWYRWEVLMIVVRGVFDVARRAAQIWGGFY